MWRSGVRSLTPRLEPIGKLRESFEFQNASLKEYDKFSLPLERSVIKTLNDDARQSYGFVLVAIWSSGKSSSFKLENDWELNMVEILVFINKTLLKHFHYDLQ